MDSASVATISAVVMGGILGWTMTATGREYVSVTHGPSPKASRPVPRPLAAQCQPCSSPGAPVTRFGDRRGRDASRRALVAGWLTDVTSRHLEPRVSCSIDWGFPRRSFGYHAGGLIDETQA